MMLPVLRRRRLFRGRDNRNINRAGRRRLLTLGAAAVGVDDGQHLTVRYDAVRRHQSRNAFLPRNAFLRAARVIDLRRPRAHCLRARFQQSGGK
jgi:hypothetical protein